MKPHFKRAYNALQKIGCPVFTNSDHESLGNFGICAEESKSGEFVDYYRENPEWAFGVSPRVEAILTRHGLFAEWRDCGSLNVYVA